MQPTTGRDWLVGWSIVWLIVAVADKPVSRRRGSWTADASSGQIRASVVECRDVSGSSSLFCVWRAVIVDRRRVLCLLWFPLHSNPVHASSQSLRLPYAFVVRTEEKETRFVFHFGLPHVFRSVWLMLDVPLQYSKKSWFEYVRYKQLGLSVLTGCSTGLAFPFSPSVSVCPSDLHGLLTQKKKRRRETTICVNVPRGRSNGCAYFQHKRLKVKS